MRVARATESIALESDAWHLRTDVYTSLGVFAGPVALLLTGIVALDALIAIAVAVGSCGQAGTWCAGPGEPRGPAPA